MTIGKQRHGRPRHVGSSPFRSTTHGRSKRAGSWSSLGCRSLCRGTSVIVSPLGEIVAGPETGGEAVVRADLDLDAIPEAKYDFDVVGHYARSDIFRLVVNEQPMPPVVAERGDAHPTPLGLGEASPQPTLGPQDGA